VVYKEVRRGLLSEVNKAFRSIDDIRPGQQGFILSFFCLGLVVETFLLYSQAHSCQYGVDSLVSSSSQLSPSFLLK